MNRLEPPPAATAAPARAVVRRKSRRDVEALERLVIFIFLPGSIAPGATRLDTADYQQQPVGGNRPQGCANRRGPNSIKSVCIRSDSLSSPAVLMDIQRVAQVLQIVDWRRSKRNRRPPRCLERAADALVPNRDLGSVVLVDVAILGLRHEEQTDDE